MEGDLLLKSDAFPRVMTSDKQIPPEEEIFVTGQRKQVTDLDIEATVNRYHYESLEKLKEHLYLGLD